MNKLTSILVASAIIIITGCIRIPLNHQPISRSKYETKVYHETIQSSERPYERLKQERRVYPFGNEEVLIYDAYGRLKHKYYIRRR